LSPSSSKKTLKHTVNFIKQVVLLVTYISNVRLSRGFNNIPINELIPIFKTKTITLLPIATLSKSGFQLFLLFGFLRTSPLAIVGKFRSRQY
jgi:hypothetical protein